MLKINISTKITYNNNLDNVRNFKRETTFTSESWVRRLHVSSEGEDSLIILPMLKTNDHTKKSYDNNLDNNQHFKERLQSPHNFGHAACKL